MSTPISGESGFIDDFDAATDWDDHHSRTNSDSDSNDEECDDDN